MRHSIGRVCILSFMVVLAAGVALEATDGMPRLEFVSPVEGESLQHKTDDFVLFFAPMASVRSLTGFRLSITNTSAASLSIAWEDSYFVLPSGERSDAILDDLPQSLQAQSTDVYTAETRAVAVIPLSNVSYSESGWSINSFGEEPGAEFALHLKIEGTQEEDFDYTFRVVDYDEVPDAPDRDRTGGTSILMLLLAGLLGLGIGLLIGKL